MEWLFLETAVQVSPSVVQPKFAGKLSCLVYLALSNITANAKQQITADIMRLLRMR